MFWFSTRYALHHTHVPTSKSPATSFTYSKSTTAHSCASAWLATYRFTTSALRIAPSSTAFAVPVHACTSNAMPYDNAIYASPAPHARTLVTVHSRLHTHRAVIAWLAALFLSTTPHAPQPPARSAASFSTISIMRSRLPEE